MVEFNNGGAETAMLKWLRDLIDLWRPVGRKPDYVEWRSPYGNYCWFSFGFDPNVTMTASASASNCHKAGAGWTRTGKVRRNDPRAA